MVLAARPQVSKVKSQPSRSRRKDKIVIPMLSATLEQKSISLLFEALCRVSEAVETHRQ